MSPPASTGSSPVSLLQQHRPSLVTPLTSRPASPQQEQPNPLEAHELHCHEARGGMYAAQLKRARSQTPSVRSNSRTDREFTMPTSPSGKCPSSLFAVPPLSRQLSPALSPIPSTSSGVRYLNKDPVSRITTLCPTPTTAISNEQVESGHALECTDSACALLALATEGSAGMVKPKAEWQVRPLLSSINHMPQC